MLTDARRRACSSESDPCSWVDLLTKKRHSQPLPIGGTSVATRSQVGKSWQKIRGTPLHECALPRLGESHESLGIDICSWPFRMNPTLRHVAVAPPSQPRGTTLCASTTVPHEFAVGAGSSGMIRVATTTSRRPRVIMDEVSARSSAREVDSSCPRAAATDTHASSDCFLSSPAGLARCGIGQSRSL